MGAYAAQSDLERRFGTTNIAKWSQLDASLDSNTADTANIAAAILEAEADINDRFRDSRYVVPLVGNSGTPKMLIKWVSIIAGMALSNSRAGQTSADDQKIYESWRDDMDREIDQYLSGSRSLDCQLKSLGGQTTSAPWVAS